MSKPITDKHARMLAVVSREMSFYEIEECFYALHGQVRRNKVYELLSDMVEAGELVRVRRGVYAPAGVKL